MAKTHYKIAGVNAVIQGQTQFDYDHQTLCDWFIALLKDEVEIATLDDVDALNIY